MLGERTPKEQEDGEHRRFPLEKETKKNGDEAFGGFEAARSKFVEQEREWHHQMEQNAAKRKLEQEIFRSPLEDSPFKKRKNSFDLQEQGQHNTPKEDKAKQEKETSGAHKAAQSRVQEIRSKFEEASKEWQSQPFVFTAVAPVVTILANEASLAQPATEEVAKEEVTSASIEEEKREVRHQATILERHTGAVAKDASWTKEEICTSIEEAERDLRSQAAVFARNVNATMKGARSLEVSPATASRLPAVTDTEVKASEAQSIVASSRTPACWPQGLSIFEMQMQDEIFDPTHAETREEILKQLGASSNSVISGLEGFSGGLNEGIWFLSEPSKVRGDLTLKLVKGSRKYPEFPTEAENLLRLHKAYPSIVEDLSVSFPFQIGHLFTPSLEKYDLLVMRRAAGKSFSDHISLKCCFRQMGKLQDIMGRIGSSLHRFHVNYGGQQHGDLQASNIFYDEENDAVTFIDVGGIGIPTMESDSEHFQKSMRLCYGGYGPEIMVDGMACFLQGLGVSNASYPMKSA